MTNERALLDRCIAILRKIKSEGDFYKSCIEFDPFDVSVDGEEMYLEITSILEDYDNKIENGKN